MGCATARPGDADRLPRSMRGIIRQWNGAATLRKAEDRPYGPGNMQAINSGGTLERKIFRAHLDGPPVHAFVWIVSYAFAACACRAVFASHALRSSSRCFSTKALASSKFA